MAFAIKFRTISATARLTQWNAGSLPLRTQVLAQRNRVPRPPGTTTIPVRLNLPDSLNFQWAPPNNAAQTTSATNCNLTYDLDVYTVYPHNLRINNNDIRFNPTYNRVQNVSNFTGIMIAEQIRFSTLQDSITNPAYGLRQDSSSQNYFNFFYDNFKGHSGGLYNQWSALGAGPVSDYRLRNNNLVNIRIPVPYQRAHDLDIQSIIDITILSQLCRDLVFIRASILIIMIYDYFIKDFYRLLQTFINFSPQYQAITPKNHFLGNKKRSLNFLSFNIRTSFLYQPPQQTKRTIFKEKSQSSYD